MLGSTKLSKACLRIVAGKTSKRYKPKTEKLSQNFDLSQKPPGFTPLTPTRNWGLGVSVLLVRPRLIGQDLNAEELDLQAKYDSVFANNKVRSTYDVERHRAYAEVERLKAENDPHLHVRTGILTRPFSTIEQLRARQKIYETQFQTAPRESVKADHNPRAVQRKPTEMLLFAGKYDNPFYGDHRWALPSVYVDEGEVLNMAVERAIRIFLGSKAQIYCPGPLPMGHTSVTLPKSSPYYHKYQGVKVLFFKMIFTSNICLPNMLILSDYQWMEFPDVSYYLDDTTRKVVKLWAPR